MTPEPIGQAFRKKLFPARRSIYLNDGIKSCEQNPLTVPTSVSTTIVQIRILTQYLIHLPNVILSQRFLVITFELFPIYFQLFIFSIYPSID